MFGPQLTQIIILPHSSPLNYTHLLTFQQTSFAVIPIAGYEQRPIFKQTFFKIEVFGNLQTKSTNGLDSLICKMRYIDPDRTFHSHPNLYAGFRGLTPEEMRIFIGSFLKYLCKKVYIFRPAWCKSSFHYFEAP